MNPPLITRKGLPALALVVAVGIILAIGGYGLVTVNSQVRASIWIEHTYTVIGQLDRLVSAIAVAESSVRGFALSREEQLLGEVPNAIFNARASVGQLDGLVSDNYVQARRVKELIPKVERRLELLTEFLDRARMGGSTAIKPESIQLSLEIRNTAAFMVQHEQMLLAQRIEKHRAENDRVINVCGFGLLTSLLLVGGAFTLTRSENRKRLLVETELAQRHNDTALLLELSEMLQACRSLDEAFTVISRFAPKLFAESHSGAMFFLNASRNWLEPRAHFGSYPVNDHGMLLPDDCWSLRRGTLHLVAQNSTTVPCSHSQVSSRGAKASLCVPLHGHAELLGMLHLLAGQRFSESFEKRIVIIAEQVSIALSNLALREKLRNESIRDPLTGLFNRRYTEETFERELNRAMRQRGALSVMMLDVDHFKRFNDTFGHEAGDRILREIGGFLRAYTRGGDIASRMGGEELLVILPGADIETARNKAEEIRAAIAKLRIVHAGADVGEVTISIGIAGFPQQGQAADELMRAADRALYEAKHAGRNRVVVS